jgi:uncharacterized protein DUF2690
MNVLGSVSKLLPRRPQLLAVGLLVAGGLVVLAPATPALAATPCYWKTFGTDSNCDGLYRYQTTCGYGTVVASTHLLYPDGTKDEPVIQLIYSSACRTIYAQLINGYPEDPSSSAGCSAKIVRTYDGQAYIEPVDPGLTFAFTKMVYDQGVTAYAYGSCDGGAVRTEARTAAY